MKITNDYIEEIMIGNFEEGYNEIELYVQEVDPIFLEEFLYKYSEITIHVNILNGLKNGIMHNILVELQRLNNTFTDRLYVNYLKNINKELRRCIVFKNPESLFVIERQKKVYLGTFEFTRSYFYNETTYFIELDDKRLITELYSYEQILVNDESLENVYPVHVINKFTLLKASDSSEKIVAVGYEYLSTEVVTLSLTNRKGDVPEKSGLNWGHRPKRNKSQMYIPVPLSIHQQHEEFFPLENQGFIIVTPEGENLICLMAQANRKAIQTKGNTSILGSYFRQRLGLGNDAFIVKEDLIKYGRSEIQLFKIKDGLYYLDF